MRGWLVAIAIAGCGDNVSPCNYREATDTNSGEIAELTGLVIDNLSASVCGRIDGGHYDVANQIVDTDRFRLTIGGTGDILVQLVGDTSASLFSEIDVRVFDTSRFPKLVAAGRLDLALADHLAFAAQLDPGDYDFVVAAQAPGDLSGTSDYRLRVSPGPAKRCPVPMGEVDYREAHDGPDATGNDMVDVDFKRSVWLTRSSGAPEPTRLSVRARDSFRLSGESAAIDPTTRNDEYLDRDTFAIHTDSTANELSVRLDWSSTTDAGADLDYLVIEPSTLAAVAIANTTSVTEHEFQTFAVKPSTDYWIWVGAFKGSSGATPFDLAVCGGHFFE
jgi:hypothetical protein